MNKNFENEIRAYMAIMTSSMAFLFATIEKEVTDKTTKNTCAEMHNTLISYSKNIYNSYEKKE